MGRWLDREKSSLFDTALMKSKAQRNTLGADALECRCFVQATDGKKTISTSVCFRIQSTANSGRYVVLGCCVGEPGHKDYFDKLKATTFKVIVQNENQIEVSFSWKWDVSLKGKLAPMNLDKRYIMLKDSSGFYTYGIFDHPKGFPEFSLAEARVAFKLSSAMFYHMTVSDTMQREMPAYEDHQKGQPLAYPSSSVNKSSQSSSQRRDMTQATPTQELIAKYLHIFQDRDGKQRLLQQIAYCNMAVYGRRNKETQFQYSKLGAATLDLIRASFSEDEDIDGEVFTFMF